MLDYTRLKIKTGVSPRPNAADPPAKNQEMINSQFKFEGVMKNNSFFQKLLLKFEGQFDFNCQGKNSKWVNFNCQR